MQLRRTRRPCTQHHDGADRPSRRAGARATCRAAGPRRPAVAGRAWRGSSPSSRRGSAVHRQASARGTSRPASTSRSPSRRGFLVHVGRHRRIPGRRRSSGRQEGDHRDHVERDVGGDGRPEPVVRGGRARRTRAPTITRPGSWSSWKWLAPKTATVMPIATTGGRPRFRSARWSSPGRRSPRRSAPTIPTMSTSRTTPDGAVGPVGERLGPAPPGRRRVLVEQLEERPVQERQDDDLEDDAGQPATASRSRQRARRPQVGARGRCPSGG